MHPRPWEQVFLAFSGPENCLWASRPAWASSRCRPDSASCVGADLGGDRPSWLLPPTPSQPSPGPPHRWSLRSLPSCHSTQRAHPGPNGECAGGAQEPLGCLLPWGGALHASPSLTPDTDIPPPAPASAPVHSWPLNSCDQAPCSSLPTRASTHSTDFPKKLPLSTAMGRLASPGAEPGSSQRTCGAGRPESQDAQVPACCELEAESRAVGAG